MITSHPTRAWLRVKKLIDKDRAYKRVKKVEKAPAMRLLQENPTSRDGEKKMATAKQRAAARKNIKKAQAARRRKMRGGRRTTRRRRRMRTNPVAKTAAGRRRQRAAARRNIKKAQRARRRTRRVGTRVRAIRRAAGPGGVRLVRVRPASTPIVIEEKVRRRRKTSRRRRRTVMASPKRRRRTVRRRRRLQANEGMTFRKSRRDMMLDNPNVGFNGLQPNQAFSMSAIRAFGTAGAGVGIGLVVADFLDRFVATRKPTNGQNPWYGANAAAAVNRRPDAWRLGAQAAGGLGAMALAYVARGRSIFPWLLGGTAVGFFANLTKQLLNWYAMPMVFRVASPNEATFANRMYPLEQRSIQDEVDALFENFASTPALAANQQDPPLVASPRPGGAGSSPVYTLGRRGNGLGKARTQAEVGNGQVGQPVLVPTGRLGMCESCGGDNGCWSHCSDLTLCGDCGDEPVARRCEYTVQPGDLPVAELATRYGVDVSQVGALNPPNYWLAGNRVVLPYAMCRAMERSSLSGVPAGAPDAISQSSNGNAESNGVHVPPPVVASSLPFGLADLPDE
jgi:hypothetical protein